MQSPSNHVRIPYSRLQRRWERFSHRPFARLGRLNGDHRYLDVPGSAWRSPHESPFPVEASQQWLLGCGAKPVEASPLEMPETTSRPRRRYPSASAWSRRNSDGRIGRAAGGSRKKVGDQSVFHRGHRWNGIILWGCVMFGEPVQRVRSFQLHDWLGGTVLSFLGGGVRVHGKVFSYPLA